MARKHAGAQLRRATLADGMTISWWERDDGAVPTCVSPKEAAERQIVEAHLITAEHARAGIKRDTPKPVDDVEGRQQAVAGALILAGLEPRPAKTKKCVDRIRPHLPEEHRRATFRQLYEALGKAKERITKKDETPLQSVSSPPLQKRVRSRHKVGERRSQKCLSPSIPRK